MLVVSGVVFFLCQAPFATVNLSGWICQMFGIDNLLLGALGAYAGWIFKLALRLNCVVNPLRYCAFSSQYRAAFTEAFRCNWQQHATNQTLAMVFLKVCRQVSRQNVSPLILGQLVRI